MLGVLIPGVREFFVLAWPDPGTWLTIVVAGGAAVVGIEIVHLVRRRWWVPSLAIDGTDPQDHRSRVEDVIFRTEAGSAA